MEVSEGKSNESSSLQEAKESEKFSSDYETLEKFTAAGFQTLIELTKSSNKLPFGKNRDLYESSPNFLNIMKSQSNYVLSVLSMIMKNNSCKGNIFKNDDEDKFEMIVDANDSILEKVGISLDDISGVRKNPEPELIAKKAAFFNGSWNRNNGIVNQNSQVLNMILNKTKNIEKPQLSFSDKINNDPSVPFEPKIKTKYNILKPLAIILEDVEEGVCQFCHPYEFELTKFKPPDEQLVQQTPKMYKSLEETPLHMVETPDDVSLMIQDLKKYKEISVDLEHHSYRSFQGFTCLLQISTRDSDYVVDTLALRSDLEPLNEIFTDPMIVKVFHGADLDVLWLQRDLALYVVNMFDTHQAVKLLNYPKLSLAYLLSFYCNVEAQKHFQLADWRIRPLPQELINYAREDTHYLLYIYDNLKNALIEKAKGQTNLVESVIAESTRICLKRYFKPIFETDGYLDIYHRSKKLFDNRQKFALQQLYEWRDTIARELDESYAYVLPNHMMLNISEALPREAQGILACCNPIPTPVRQNLLVLHQMILKAREQPLIKPVLEEQRFYRHTTAVNASDNPLTCPHDLNHEGEFRDDLPVLISDGDSHLSSNVQNFPADSVHCNPIIDVFEKILEPSKKFKMQSVVEQTLYLNPYHRYKLAKQFSESMEAKATTESNKEKQTVSSNQSGAEKESLDHDENPCKKKRLDEADGKKSKEEDKTEKNLKTMKMEENRKREASNPKKRKMKEEGDIHPKKLKEENSSNSEIPSHDPSQSRINASQHQKTKSDSNNTKTKEKVFRGKGDKQFQPFDYGSVNYGQYQTNEVHASKKNQRKVKRKKKGGKKNFKISV